TVANLMARLVAWRGRGADGPMVEYLEREFAALAGDDGQLPAAVTSLVRAVVVQLFTSGFPAERLVGDTAPEWLRYEGVPAWTVGTMAAAALAWWTLAANRGLQNADPLAEHLRRVFGL